MTNEALAVVRLLSPDELDAIEARWKAHNFTILADVPALLAIARWAREAQGWLTQSATQRPFGSHLGTCPLSVRHLAYGSCTCGLTALLAAVTTEETTR